MEDKEVMAVKLGFSSAEEMEAYYDICRGQFQPEVVMTKELCDTHIIVGDKDWENLLHAPREERLEGKLHWDFDVLIESIKDGDNESVERLRSLIDYELSEFNKCCEMKEQKTL